METRSRAMPNHWHFVVRPTCNDQVSKCFCRLTGMHTMRWHAHHHTGGIGHLYQGRFNSFPIQDDEHLLTVIRYVDRNPVRANLIAKDEEWRWGSAWARSQKAAEHPWLRSPSSPPIPRQWRAWVNKPQSQSEVDARRNCIRRGCPFIEAAHSEATRGPGAASRDSAWRALCGQDEDPEKRPDHICLSQRL